MALSAYLRLVAAGGPIPGSVTRTGLVDTIEVSAVDHQVNAALDARGLPTRPYVHQAIVVTIGQDRSWPLLWRALDTTERLTTFRLDFWRPTTSGTEEQFYTISLTNAYISGIKMVMLNNRAPVASGIETRHRVSFTYDTIEWTWQPTLGAATGTWPP